MVFHLTEHRLKYMQPYISQWPEAVKIFAFPRNISIGAFHLHRLVDEIWYLSGDRAIDVRSDQDLRSLTINMNPFAHKFLSVI
jgi:ubiquinone biosynthesis protein COQ9